MIVMIMIISSSSDSLLNQLQIHKMNKVVKRAMILFWSRLGYRNKTMINMRVLLWSMKLLKKEFLIRIHHKTMKMKVTLFIHKQRVT